MWLLKEIVLGTFSKSSTKSLRWVDHSTFIWQRFQASSAGEFTRHPHFPRIWSTAKFQKLLLPIPPMCGRPFCPKFTLQSPSITQGRSTITLFSLLAYMLMNSLKRIKDALCSQSQPFSGIINIVMTTQCLIAFPRDRSTIGPKFLKPKSRRVKSTRRQTEWSVSGLLDNPSVFDHPKSNCIVTKQPRFPECTTPPSCWRLTTAGSNLQAPSPNRMRMVSHLRIWVQSIVLQGRWSQQEEGSCS